MILGWKLFTPQPHHPSPCPPGAELVVQWQSEVFPELISSPHPVHTDNIRVFFFSPSTWLADIASFSPPATGMTLEAKTWRRGWWDVEGVRGSDYWQWAESERKHVNLRGASRNDSLLSAGRRYLAGDKREIKTPGKSNPDFFFFFPFPANSCRAVTKEHTQKKRAISQDIKRKWYDLWQNKPPR